MKLKTKLVSLCLAFAMVVGVLMVGVYAVKKTNFTLGGNISFTTTGINATISAGTLSNAESWKTASDADTKMKSVEINTNKTESQLQSEFASWSGLDLVFNENADDVTITFTIKNNSSTANDYVVAYIDVDEGTSSNASISVTNAGAILDPGETETFVVTLSVNEKDTSASMTGFNISFDLRQGVVEAESSTSTTLIYEGVTYTIGENNTLSLTSGGSGSGDIAIPAYIKNNETIYTVTSIKNISYSNYTCVKIPASVTSIGMQSFCISFGLTRLIIPASVTSIGSDFLSSDVSLQINSIIVDDANTVYEDRNSNAIIEKSTSTLISGCNTTIIPNDVKILASCALNSFSFTYMNVPEGVTSIGNSVFYNCSKLTSVTLPSTLESIGSVAFGNCPSLTDIYFEGTEAQWTAAVGSNDIGIDTTKTTIHYGA